MNELIRFEWKKILTSRLNQIVLLISLLATGGMMLGTALSYSFPVNGNFENGMEAIRAEKDAISEVAGEMNQAQIETTVATYQALYDTPENSFNNEGQISLVDSVFINEVYPKYNYLLLINGIYAGPYASDYELNTLKKITSPVPDYYEERDVNVEKLLSNTYSNMQFTAAEQSYWLNKNEQVEQPIHYDYAQGWVEFLNQIEFFIFIFLVVVVGVAPIFANEYQTGAHQIILSTKLGKTKLIWAKIVTAFLYGFVVLTLHVLIALSVIAFTFGLEGLSLPVQVLHSTNPYAWTIGQFVMIQLVTVYVMLFGLIAVMLWFSAKAKSAFVALIPMVAILIIPLFLNRTETASVWNKLHSLLPFPSMRNPLGNDELTFISFSVGSFVVDVIVMRLFVYLFVGGMLILLVRKAFKGHQVS